MFDEIPISTIENTDKLNSTERRFQRFPDISLPEKLTRKTESRAALRIKHS